MHRSRPPTSREEGQILVIVAGGLIGLLAIGALVLEGGAMLLNRRDAQNGSDLAAVAGARIVSHHYTDGGRTQGEVHSEVELLLAQNGCDSASTTPCTWTANFVGDALADLGPVTDTSSPPPVGALGVQVKVTRTPEAGLGRVLKFTTWNVSTDATAVAARPSGFAAGTLLPIALCGWVNSTDPDTCGTADETAGNFIDFQPGQIYDLVEGKDAPGGFGWLSWTGSPSATALEASVCTPNSPAFSLDSPYDDVGDPSGTPGQSVDFVNDKEVWFPLGAGKMNKDSMRACLDKYIANGTTVLVPIFDAVVKDPPIKVSYHLTGVAAFVLVAREQPAVDQIQGRFIEYYQLTDLPPGGGWVPPDESDQTFFLGLVK